eukprot:5678548-Pyramimonas_sp.AAC.1
MCSASLSSTVPSLPGDAAACFPESSASGWAPPCGLFLRTRTCRNHAPLFPSFARHRAAAACDVVVSPAFQMPCVGFAKRATPADDAVP